MEFQRVPTKCDYKLPSLKEFIGDDLDTAKIVVPIQKDELFELCIDEDGTIHSDIWLIRQKERLGMYSPQDFAQLVATRFAQRQVANPYAGLTDEQLFDTIRPRYFQSPAEIKAWLDMLEFEHSELASAIESSNAEVKSDEVVESAKSE